MVLIPLPGGAGDPATAATVSLAFGVAVHLGNLFHERLRRRAGDDDLAWTFPGRLVLEWMAPLMWTVVVLYHWVAGFRASMA